MPKRTFFQRVIAYAALEREARSHPVGDAVTLRERDDVRRRPLEHRDVGGALGELRDERHGGRAAADDDDALALVVDVGRPLLRVHDAAAEALAPGELRRVALLVVVVAGAHEEEVARHAAIVSPDAPSSRASTVQRASSLDQRARSTRCR